MMGIFRAEGIALCAISLLLSWSNQLHVCQAIIDEKINGPESPSCDRACEDDYVAETTYDQQPAHNATKSNNRNLVDEDNNPQTPYQCKVYLAESSIPNAGLGVYTAVDVKKGERVGEPDLLIPITDYRRPRNKDKRRSLPDWLVSDVEWTSRTMDMFWYEADRAVSNFIPGFGALPNCHLGLINIEREDTFPYDAAGLHRSRDPGVGAFTSWHDIDYVATRDVEAGQELFINYGEAYFTHKKRRRKMGPIPNAKDYQKADRIVAKGHKLLNVDQIAGELGDARAQMWHELVANATSRSFIAKVRSKHIKRALPKHHDAIEKAYQVGTARYALSKKGIRTQAWFEEHGMCLDSVYVKPSTIPQAGRGVFTKAFVPKGSSVIMPAPMLQLNKTNLHISKRANKTMPLQLLSNYVYSHPDTDIVLLPYSTQANYVNHGNASKANARLQWSASRMHRNEFLNMDAQMVLQQGFGLIMEFVALRDIEPNEEILIDYGVAWEQAWAKHVEQWSPLEGSSTYIPANDLTKESRGRYNTEGEQKEDPYPSGVQAAVNFWLHDLIFDDIEDGYSDAKGEYTIFHARWDSDKPLGEDNCRRMCSILQRHPSTSDDEFTYDVEILPYKGKVVPEACKWNENDVMFIDEVPSEAISLVEKSYERDQHLTNAFRHPIGLSSDLMPAMWRYDAIDV